MTGLPWPERPDWQRKAFVYHVFPLGACGAPPENDEDAPVDHRLGRIADELDRLQALGVDTLLLGPVFQSHSHGYDVVDPLVVDRRLGDDADLRDLCAAVHGRGMKVMFDAVFNHVGRGFAGFQDVVRQGERSPYWSWFHLDPGGRSPFGDPFDYEGWAGNQELVKLDTDNPEVRDHLIAVFDAWLDRYGIDGLRLDAADVLSEGFLARLAAHCADRAPDLWLVGEMVEGDYTRLARPGMIHSTTNYELYKGLWSSHVDHNYFEVAFSLNRQSGQGGIYEDLTLYNFADNHDVDRVAGSLTKSAHLYTLYGLLLTIPGTPSVYYGSEFGTAQRRSSRDDSMLRPSLDELEHPEPRLAAAIARLAAVRSGLPALTRGDYRELEVTSEQMSFVRDHPDGDVHVAVNAAGSWADVGIRQRPGTLLHDHLNDEVVTTSADGAVPVAPGWLRIMTRNG